MKIIGNTYKHESGLFSITITTCNSRKATALNLNTNEEVFFNRAKLEWMINKKIFVLVNAA